jgi:uncharacterized protein
LEHQTQPIGAIVSLWRYPVKSMQGEEVPQAHLSSRGFFGDRAYALIEKETGHVVSAKHARKWAKVLQCRAVYLAAPEPGAPLPPLLLTLPDGAQIRSDDPDVNAVLSRAVGREVMLAQQVPNNATREANRAEVDDLLTQELIRQEPIARAVPGTFFDFAALHILTTSTLARLKELFPAGDFDVRRFRPNMVIAPTDPTIGFTENAWLGQCLRIGDGISIDLFDPTPRCVITTLPQADLLHQIGILKTVAQHNAAISVTEAPGVMLSAVTGVYGATQSTGILSRGADIYL